LKVSFFIRKIKVKIGNIYIYTFCVPTILKNI
jgi:hypothetical protein